MPQEELKTPPMSFLNLKDSFYKAAHAGALGSAKDMISNGEESPGTTEAATPGSGGGIILSSTKIQDKLTLFLDLDDTLIKTMSFSELQELKEPRPKPDCTLCYEHNSELVHCVVFKRKGLAEFLEWASSAFEVCVFTAGTEEYASAIVDILDSEGRLFSEVLSRQHTKKSKEKVGGAVFYRKDLTLIEGRSMHSMILVDDNVAQVEANKRNAIRILPFGDEFGNDDELEELRYLLELLRTAGDVQAFIDRIPPQEEEPEC